MGKLERLREIRFWIDYYMQDMWMRKKLKKMNNLREDTIHTGQYLTVVYFAEE